jgi:predicted phosphodiesterase
LDAFPPPLINSILVMRIALITDIHEDFQMLEKSILKLESKGYDVLVCLGDITGYSPLFYSHAPDAEACIDLIKDKADVAVAGNHDLFTSQRLPSYHASKNMPEHWYELNFDQQQQLSRNKLWLYEDEVVPVVSASNMEFLKGLKEWAVLENGVEKYLFTHFFQPDISGIGRWFPSTNFEIRTHFQFMKDMGSKLAFVGHAHPPGPTLINRFSWSNRGYESVSIKEKHRAVICPSVTSDRTPGCCSIFDTDKKEIIPVLID